MKNEEVGYRASWENIEKDKNLIKSKKSYAPDSKKEAPQYFFNLNEDAWGFVGFFRVG